MGKYRIDYSCRQVRIAYVEAKNEQDAKEKFIDGDDVISDEVSDEDEYQIEDIKEED